MTPSTHNLISGAGMNELKDLDTEVLNRKGYVMVVFYTEHCGACVGVKKLLESFANRAYIVMCDAEKQRSISSTFNIAVVPTVLVFRDGEMIKYMHGPWDPKRFADILT
jgi:thioredoxin 1